MLRFDRRRWVGAAGVFALLLVTASSSTAETRTLLLFDDEPLNVRTSMVRRVGRAQRVGEFLDPRGNSAWGYPFVFRDSVSGKWRMIYQHVRGPGPLLAESDDGLKWQSRATTSELTLTDRKLPNQLLSTGAVGMFSGGYEDHRAEPAERLKMFTVKTRTPDSALVWTSPDGIRWTKKQNARRQDVLWQSRPSDPPTFAFWNEIRQSYTMVSRPDHTDRRIALCETKDWTTFSEQELALTADALDPPLAQLYGMPVLPYEGTYVGLLWLFHASPVERSHWPHLFMGGKSDVQLAYSLDGRHWQRTLREPLLPNGAAGEPDAGCLQASCVVRLPDGVMRIYACTSVAEHARINPGDGYVCVYELRRDGFVYLENDGAKVGQIGTRALYWRGGELELNASSPAGEIRVQITDPKGKPLAGYGFSECESFTGDDVAWTPKWTSGKPMAALQDKTIRVEVRVEQGRVYALRGDFVLCRLVDLERLENGIVPTPRPGF